MEMKLLKKWMLALSAMLLTMSLFAIPAFAAEATETADKFPTWAIWAIVGGVIVIAAVVLGIIFREKIGKFLRVYKSEWKKIVWLPWNQTKKSTLVVLVVLIVCATVICLLDLGLFKGITALVEWLGDLIKDALPKA